MKKHITEFLNELLFFKKEKNLVLGGSLALIEHGLMIDWTPGDLDVIIFQPTDKQQKYIDACFESCSEYPEDKDGKEKNSVFQLKRHGLTLNVIVTKQERPPFDTLLYYCYNQEISFRINSIREIVRAISTYRTGAKKIHVRVKDIQHMQTLKNLNFNI